MIHNILNRLLKVTPSKSKRDEWRASCPLHKDDHPSMGIRLTNDGKIVMHCFSCQANGIEIIECIGLDAQDLFPPRENNKTYTKQNREYFSDSTILEVIKNEAIIMQLALSDIRNNKQWNEADLARIDLANERITHALNYRNN